MQKKAAVAKLDDISGVDFYFVYRIEVYVAFIWAVIICQVQWLIVYLHKGMVPGNWRVIQVNVTIAGSSQGELMVQFR